jgi:hypothetical protein
VAGYLQTALQSHPQLKPLLEVAYYHALIDQVDQTGPEASVHFIADHPLRVAATDGWVVVKDASSYTDSRSNKPYKNVPYGFAMAIQKSQRDVVAAELNSLKKETIRARLFSELTGRDSVIAHLNKNKAARFENVIGGLKHFYPKLARFIADLSQLLKSDPSLLEDTAEAQERRAKAIAELIAGSLISDGQVVFPSLFKQIVFFDLMLKQYEKRIKAAALDDFKDVIAKHRALMDKVMPALRVILAPRAQASSSAASSSPLVESLD